VEKAKKDGATARDIKRESLDVIKRERMQCEEGEGMQCNIKARGVPVWRLRGDI
jgi:hypothetical protein